MMILRSDYNREDVWRPSQFASSSFLRWYLFGLFFFVVWFCGGMEDTTKRTTETPIGSRDEIALTEEPMETDSQSSQTPAVTGMRQPYSQSHQQLRRRRGTREFSTPKGHPSRTRNTAQYIRTNQCMEPNVMREGRYVTEKTIIVQIMAEKDVATTDYQHIEGAMRQSYGDVASNYCSQVNGERHLLSAEILSTTSLTSTNTRTAVQTNAGRSQQHHPRSFSLQVKVVMLCIGGCLPNETRILSTAANGRRSQSRLLLTDRRNLWWGGWMGSGNWGNNKDTYLQVSNDKGATRTDNREKGTTTKEGGEESDNPFGGVSTQQGSVNDSRGYSTEQIPCYCPPPPDDIFLDEVQLRTQNLIRNGQISNVVMDFVGVIDPHIDPSSSQQAGTTEGTTTQEPPIIFGGEEIPIVTTTNAIAPFPSPAPTTKAPTVTPTSSPTTNEPTDMPTELPTTVQPSAIPTFIMTTSQPSLEPTSIPTTSVTTRLPSPISHSWYTEEPSLSTTKVPLINPMTDMPTPNPTTRPTTTTTTIIDTTNMPSNSNLIQPWGETIDPRPSYQDDDVFDIGNTGKRSYETIDAIFIAVGILCLLFVIVAFLLWTKRQKVKELFNSREPPCSPPKIPKNSKGATPTSEQNNGGQQQQRHHQQQHHHQQQQQQQHQENLIENNHITWMKSLISRIPGVINLNNQQSLDYADASTLGDHTAGIMPATAGIVTSWRPPVKRSTTREDGNDSSSDDDSSSSDEEEEEEDSQQLSNSEETSSSTSSASFPFDPSNNNKITGSVCDNNNNMTLSSIRSDYEDPIVETIIVDDDSSTIITTTTSTPAWLYPIAFDLQNEGVGDDDDDDDGGEIEYVMWKKEKMKSFGGVD